MKLNQRCRDLEQDIKQRDEQLAKQKLQEQPLEAGTSVTVQNESTFVVIGVMLSSLKPVVITLLLIIHYFFRMRSLIIDQHIFTCVYDCVPEIAAHTATLIAGYRKKRLRDAYRTCRASG